jgi:hypothetical protein
VPASGGRWIEPVPLPINNDISTLLLDAAPNPPAEPELVAFTPSAAGSFEITHPDEARQVAAVRKHRFAPAGNIWRIVRGDVHRHTGISMDGAVGGSLYDWSSPIFASRK